jgi:hypothetical protein
MSYSMAEVKAQSANLQAQKMRDEFKNIPMLYRCAQDGYTDARKVKPNFFGRKIDVLERRTQKKITKLWLVSTSHYAVFGREAVWSGFFRDYPEHKALCEDYYIKGVVAGIRGDDLTTMLNKAFDAAGINVQEWESHTNDFYMPGTCWTAADFNARDNSYIL